MTRPIIRSMVERTQSTNARSDRQWGPIGTPDGSLGLKHIHGGFGIITMQDLAWAVFKVVDQNTKADIATFASIDELIAAGWVVD